MIADQIESRAAASKGACGYGFVGAVVGATYPRQLDELRRRMPSAWILVPGFGAQGGTARDVAPALDGQGLGAIVNSSRAILGAHRDPRFSGSAQAWEQAVESACRDAIEQLRAETNASKLG
jgi:orotidine-5'-phosphate decarboxylase